MPGLSTVSTCYGVPHLLPIKFESKENAAMYNLQIVR